MRPLWKAIYRAYPLRRGKGRLFEFVRRKVGGRMLMRSDESVLLLDLDNYIDCVTYLEGSYEAQALWTIETAAVARGCDCFIDVGANIGIHSLHFARLESFVEIWAFEPDPRNLVQLRANLWLNDALDRVRVFDVALSDADGTTAFYLNRASRKPGDPQFNTGSSSLKHERSPHHEPYTIDCTSLDRVLPLSGRKVLLKIDVEGAEEEVLRGAAQVLRSNDCVVMIEVWPEPADQLERITGLLGDWGYLRVATDLGEDNFLFVRSEGGPG